MQPYQYKFFPGDVVRVIDEKHKMCGWTGVVTSPLMWPRPKYREIPPFSRRIEMDSGDGRFYGDYHEDQLELVRSARKG